MTKWRKKKESGREIFKVTLQPHNENTVFFLFFFSNVDYQSLVALYQFTLNLSR